LDIIKPPLNVCKWSLRWIENSQVRGGDELQNSNPDADGLAVIRRPAHVRAVHNRQGVTGGADVRLERGRRVGEEDSVGVAGRWRLESKIKIGQFARDRIE
jgi:hypothetical protein